MLNAPVEALRWLSVAQSLALGALAGFGLREALLDGVATKQGSQLAILALYLLLFALLLLIAHLGCPMVLLRRFRFLRSHAGQGLFEILVGGSVMVLGRTHSMFAMVIGATCAGIGLLNCGVACCVTLDRGPPRDDGDDDDDAVRAPPSGSKRQQRKQREHEERQPIVKAGSVSSSSAAAIDSAGVASGGSGSRSGSRIGGTAAGDTRIDVSRRGAGSVALVDEEAAWNSQVAAAAAAPRTVGAYGSSGASAAVESSLRRPPSAYEQDEHDRRAWAAATAPPPATSVPSGVASRPSTSGGGSGGTRGVPRAKVANPFA